MRRIKIHEPNRTAAWVTTGVMTLATAYNAVAAAVGRQPAARSATNVSVLALTLLTALALNCVASRPTYARFLRDVTLTAAAVTAASAACLTARVGPEPWLRDASAYALGMTAGFALLLVAERVTRHGR